MAWRAWGKGWERSPPFCETDWTLVVTLELFCSYFGQEESRRLLSSTCGVSGDVDPTRSTEVA